MLEIERKFLISPQDDSWRREVIKSYPIFQGYFKNGGAEAASVRIRITGDKGNLNIKGPGGIGRAEYSYSIPLSDAQDMMERFCGDRVVKKTRYLVPAAEKGLTWEIDEYHGAFAGHYTAELEIPSEDTPFTKPAWLGREVTGQAQYLNAALANAQRWPDAQNTNGTMPQ